MDASKKMQTVVCAMIIVALLHIAPHIGFAQGFEDDSLEIISEGKFQAPAGSSEKLAKGIALFEAKKKAVESAGRYLAGQHLILNFELKKEEIYSLAARKIDSKILAERRVSSGKTVTYHIRIQTRIEAADYNEADSLDKQLEFEEKQEPLKEELEPEISNAIDPGLDIAKAYILLRTEKLRPAMIYLDRLEKKYPGWGAVYMAKAMGYYLLLEPLSMKKELDRACTVGNEKACDDLKNLKRVRQFDFETEKIN